jgi:Putative quorum-sensing-regulated virulence factor
MNGMGLARFARRTAVYVGGSFSAFEEKLLRMALDPAARGGEITSSAAKLIDSLRRRGVRAEQIIIGSELAERTAIEKAAAVQLHFGKHKGKPIADVPRDYLQWSLKNVASLSLEQRNAIRLVLTAERGRD